MYQLLHNRVLNSWTPVVQDLATFALNSVVSSSLSPVNSTALSLLQFITHTGTYTHTHMHAKTNTRTVHGYWTHTCVDIHSITDVYKDTQIHRYIHKWKQILTDLHTCAHPYTCTDTHTQYTHA